MDLLQNSRAFSFEPSLNESDALSISFQAFLDSVRELSTQKNIVAYFVGLGNPDDELMSRAAALCGGENFKPEDAGELLIWYSKRARDLTIKLKAHKE